MSKKIILLALTAISAVALFALPAVASAEDIPLHLNPTPEGAKTIDDVGANPQLTTTSGTTIECETFHGSATFESSTTGTIELTFSGNCHGPFGVGCSNETGTNSIVTTTLPFHLVTLPNEKPGVLVTSKEGHFATFTCGFLKEVVSGNGVIGTITQPKCGEASTSATIDFNATAAGVQEHTTVAGTTT